MYEGEKQGDLDAKYLKYAPLIPIYAFALSLFHELGLSYALGINLFRFYQPSDFINISIQYVLIAIIPWIAQGCMVYLDIKRDQRQPSEPKLTKKAVIIFLAIVAFIFIAHLSLGVPQEFFGLYLVILITGLIPPLYSLMPFSKIVNGSLTILALSSLYSFASGKFEGDAILEGRDASPEIIFTGEVDSGSQYFLVRMLSSGILVHDQHSNIIFTRNEYLKFSSINIVSKKWNGFICNWLHDCGIFDRLKNQDLTVTIPLGPPTKGSDNAP